MSRGGVADYEYGIFCTYLLGTYSKNKLRLKLSNHVFNSIYTS